MASLTSACAWQYADWNVQGPGSKEDIEDDGDGPQCSVEASDNLTPDPAAQPWRVIIVKTNINKINRDFYQPVSSVRHYLRHTKSFQHFSPIHSGFSLLWKVWHKTLLHKERGSCITLWLISAGKCLWGHKQRTEMGDIRPSLTCDAHLICYNVTMLQVITSSSSPAPVIFPSARGLIEHRTCLFCVFSFYILYIVICIWKLCSYMNYIYWPYLKFQIKMFWYSPVSAGLYSHLPTDSL